MSESLLSKGLNLLSSFFNVDEVLKTPVILLYYILYYMIPDEDGERPQWPSGNLREIILPLPGTGRGNSIG